MTASSVLYRGSRCTADTPSDRGAERHGEQGCEPVAPEHSDDRDDAEHGRQVPEPQHVEGDDVEPAAQVIHCVHRQPESVEPGSPAQLSFMIERCSRHSPRNTRIASWPLASVTSTPDPKPAGISISRS